MSESVKTSLYLDELQGSIYEQIDALSEKFDQVADKARKDPAKIGALTEAHDVLFELYTALEKI